MRNKLFSIVIPLYNERGNVVPLLEYFYDFSNEYNFELILVNDGSNDGTHNFLKKLSSKYKHFIKIISYKKNKGYGGAILTGLKNAKGDILGWMHSDLQTDVKYIFKAYDLYLNFKQDNVIIKGNRINRKLGQIFFSNIMGIICSIIFGYKLFEINAQPKVFSRGLYEKFSNPPLDFSLDLYLLILAKKYGYLFDTIDVNFIDRIYGYSKWKISIKLIIKTIYRSLLYIMKLKLGFYKKNVKINDKNYS